MQDYTYSVFSSVAILIHLIINFRLLFGSGEGLGSARVMRYRGFLLGVLFYYVADATWGVFAGLGWTGPLYVDTILFFLSFAAFLLFFPYASGILAPVSWLEAGKGLLKIWY